MTDILLIQPPIEDFYLTRKRTIPYGLVSIAAVLLAHGYTVELLDCLASGKSRLRPLPPEMDYLIPYYGKPDISPFGLFHHYRHFGYSYAHIAKTVKALRPRIVGISSLFTPYFGQALKAAEIVKSAAPDCRVVLGGHHPTVMPAKVMAHNCIDYVIRGEGEVGFLHLANALLRTEFLQQVPGIVYRTPAGTLEVKPPVFMEDLDQYPLPALERIDAAYYRRGGDNSGVILTSRGCPMKCSYCCVSAETIPYRKKSVERVLDEIAAAVEFNSVRFIDFEDENLTLDRKWFLRLLKGLIERYHSAGIEFRAMNGLFPPTLDAEILERMQTAGFKALNLSIGALAPDQLKRFNRPDIRSHLERVLALAETFGFKSVGYIIVGAPFQKAESALSDLLYLAQSPMVAGVSVYYPAPGSRDFGIYAKDPLFPSSHVLMRSSAVSIDQEASNGMTRTQTITLLRLGRLLNFMKGLKQDGEEMPEALPISEAFERWPQSDRRSVGRALLAGFLWDGRIRGVTPEGEIYPHLVDEPLSNRFLNGLLKTGCLPSKNRVEAR